MNQRVSREDAAFLLDQIHKLTEKDKRTNRNAYNKCCFNSPNATETKAFSSEVLYEIIDGLTSKLHFFQSFVVEQILAKCTYLLGQFMKDYGVLMDAAVQEILDVITFFKSGIQNLLSVVVALISEKDLYAEKALTLAKGFVSSSNHTFDILSIQPRFGYLDIISDICFKSDSDVSKVIHQLYVTHKQVSDGRFQSYIPGETKKSTLKEKVRSTGDNLGYIENIYNQQLLGTLSEDIYRTVAFLKSVDAEKNATETDEATNVVVVNDSDSNGVETTDAAVVVLAVSFAEREKCARRVQRFVYKFWVTKQKLKRKRIDMVYDFLSRSTFRMRARVQMFKRRRQIHSRRVICQTVYNYISYCKLKEKSRKIIRINVRKLFRNFLFRDMSTSCRLGAQRLIQREWALRHSDIDLRLLRIETYLNAMSTERPAPYKICDKPSVPLAKHDAYMSTCSWENIDEYSRDELIECNLHILNLTEIDKEKDVSVTSISESLDVFESACLVSDVEMSTRMRLTDGKSLSTIAESAPPCSSSYQKGRRLSKHRVRRATAVTPGARGGAVDSSQRSKRAGHSHSHKHSKAGAGGGAGVSAASIGTSNAFDFEGSSLLSQLDHIKKSL
jgi:hypothetical protein